VEIVLTGEGEADGPRGHAEAAVEDEGEVALD